MLLVTPWWHTPTGWSHWTVLDPGELWRVGNGEYEEAICWCLFHQSLSSLFKITCRRHVKELHKACDMQVADRKGQQLVWAGLQLMRQHASVTSWQCYLNIGKVNACSHARQREPSLLVMLFLCSLSFFSPPNLPIKEMCGFHAMWLMTGAVG